MVRLYQQYYQHICVHLQHLHLQRNWPISSKFYNKYSSPTSQLGLISKLSRLPSIYIVELNNSSNKKAGIPFDRNLSANFIEFRFVS